MQDERADQHAARDEVGDHFGGERTAGARHLDAARLSREDRLVAVERPLAGNVAVANRARVLIQVVGDDTRDLELRQPQPLRVGEGREQIDVALPSSSIPLHD